LTLKELGFVLRWERVDGRRGREGEREEEKLLIGVLERNGVEAIGGLREIG